MRMISLATCVALVCLATLFPLDRPTYVQAQQVPSLGELSVTDYGANGADEADDTIAFQACATVSIRFTNNNANGARLQVSNCRFQGTGDSAILAAPLVPPFFSSHVTIDQCKWFACKRAITTWSDITTLSHSWIQWSETGLPQNLCCIEVLGGRFNISDSLFVPVFPGGALGRRWIGWWGFPQRNGGSGIFADRTRFGGEHGGLPPIAIHSPPDLLYPFQGPSVTLRGCQLSCGQTSWPDTAVINCNGGLPQTVYLDACTSVIGPCPLIRDQAGTTEAIVGQLQNAAGRIRIVIGANCFYPLNPPVPTFLQQYVRNLAL